MLSPGKGNVCRIELLLILQTAALVGMSLSAHRPESMAQVRGEGRAARERAARAGAA